MHQPLPENERLLDLLAARATEGLAPGDDLELRHLLVAHPGLSVDELEPAAAVLDRALDRARDHAVEPLAAELRERILLGAQDHLPRAGSSRPGSSAAGWAGWAAAAAMLALALWLGFGSSPAPELPKPTLAAQRDSLLQVPDAVVARWSSDIADYADVEGDVVWSDARQAGFMRLRGLPVNDPAAAQYQLWIVDPSRDTEPVDGGVFDVPAESEEVIVPIDAKLQVRDPRVFAITLEKPGGVVVSAGPLLVVASATG